MRPASSGDQADHQRARRLADQLSAFLPLVARVIDQGVRRVLAGEQVPAYACLDAFASTIRLP